MKECLENIAKKYGVSWGMFKTEYDNTSKVHPSPTISLLLTESRVRAQMKIQSHRLRYTGIGGLYPDLSKIEFGPYKENGKGYHQNS